MATALRAKIEMESGSALGAEAVKDTTLEALVSASRQFKVEMREVIDTRTPVFTGALHGDLAIYNSLLPPDDFGVDAPNTPYYRYVKALNVGEAPRAPKLNVQPRPFLRAKKNSTIVREQLISVLGGEAKDRASACVEAAMAISGLDIEGGA